MKTSKKLIGFLFLIILFSQSIIACDSTQRSHQDITSSPTILTETLQSVSTPTPTAKPTFTPTASLAPVGDEQPIPKGYYYLGDKHKVALGFNMDAGGAIGSLLFNGKEFVDDLDYGRYIQLSYYDGNQKYEPLGSDPFGNYGWDPIQAGSKTQKGAKVLDFRTLDDEVYIKALGKEWGEDNVDSDVIFETWAWLRDGYFELHIRSTHIGTNTHAWAWQEFPAAYFDSLLTQQYSYIGNKPFTAQPINQLDIKEDNRRNIIPSENWVAYSNKRKMGLILAAPPQRYLSPIWGYCLLNSGSSTVGYAAPIAIFDNPPNSVHEVKFYLLPGDIENNRALVYDLIPHNNWTFDLNSKEGWESPSSQELVHDGVLTTTLLPNKMLTSFSNLHISGVITPSVTINARTDQTKGNLCLSFITTTDPYWDTNKQVCNSSVRQEYSIIDFDFRSVPEWTEGIITQLGLTSTSQTTIDIDSIIVNSHGYAWDFDSTEDSEGWWPWNQVVNAQVNQGTFQGQSSGNDPYIGSAFISADSTKLTKIQLRMKVSAGDSAQLFFITDLDDTYDESKSISFSVLGDGEFHTYILDMSKIKSWKDVITQIRLDPSETTAKFEIDYIRIIE